MTGSPDASVLGLPAALVNRYSDFVLLGKGGQGSVYRGHDKLLKRTVAVKVLREELALLPDFCRRFQREGRLLATVSHPNVVRFFDFEEADGVAYFTMEYVEGRSLEDVCRQGALPVREAVDLGARLAGGLAAVHAAGVVHRDIKPSNVMVDAERRPVLMDFGCGRFLSRADQTLLTRTGQLVGTPLFMPPESLMQGVCDERSDIFQLGAVLYAALTGRLPYAVWSLPELLELYRETDERSVLPPSTLAPGIDEALDSLVTRTLHRLPERRPPTAADLELACLAWLRGHDDLTAKLPAVPLAPPADAAPGRRRPRPDAPVARSRLAAACVTLALALALVVLLCGRPGRRGPPPASAMAAGAPLLEACPQHASLSFPTAVPRLLEWTVVSTPGRQIAGRGVEATPVTSHRVNVAGLAPGATYELLVREGSVEARWPFATPPARFTRGVLALAHGSGLYLDFATNLESGLSLVVTAPGEGPITQEVAAGCGPVIVPGLARPRSSALRWELRLGRTVLASGAVSGDVPPVAAFRQAWTEDGTAKEAWPACEPRWLGERVVFCDRAGDVHCLGLNRVEGANEAATPGEPTVGLVRAWSIALATGSPRTPGVRQIGGLAAVDGASLFVLAGSPGGTTAAWLFDVEARTARWDALGGRRSASGLPAFIDDEGSGWRAPISSREWRCDVGPFSLWSRGSVVARQAAFVFTITGGGAGYMCIDLRARSVAWRRFRPTPPPYVLTGCSETVLCGGRLATVASARAAPPDRPDACFLVSCPAELQPPSSEPAVFADEDCPERLSLGLDQARGEVLVTTRDSLLRLPADASVPTVAVSLPPSPGEPHAYLSGPAVPLGATYGVVHMAEERTGAKLTALRARASLLTWRPGSPYVLHEPPLYEGLRQPGERDVVRQLVRTPRFLVGLSHSTLFAVELATGRMGTWRPAGAFLNSQGIGCPLDAVAPGPFDVAVVVDSRGNAYLVSLDLVVRAGRAVLADLPKLVTAGT